MSAQEQVEAIRRFIEWREERGDVSSLEVSLDVYAEWLEAEGRRVLAQDALDSLEGDTALPPEQLALLRAALRAAL